jgi:hypothetical protein
VGAVEAGFGLAAFGGLPDGASQVGALGAEQAAGAEGPGLAERTLRTEEVVEGVVAGAAATVTAIPAAARALVLVVGEVVIVSIVVHGASPRGECRSD